LAPRGDKGFGYDPMFLPNGQTRTSARCRARKSTACATRQRAVAPCRAFMKLARHVLTEQDATLPKQDAFGVYVHWPFCLSKCPYCDFNSHVRASRSMSSGSCGRFTRKSGPQPSECATARSRRSSSVAAPVADAAVDHRGILNSIARQWRVASDVEITIEANRPASRRRAFAAIARRRQSRFAWRTGARRSRAGGARRMHTAREALDAVASPLGVRPLLV